MKKLSQLSRFLNGLLLKLALLIVYLFFFGISRLIYKISLSLDKKNKDSSWQSFPPTNDPESLLSPY